MKKASVLGFILLTATGCTEAPSLDLDSGAYHRVQVLAHEDTSYVSGCVSRRFGCEGASPNLTARLGIDGDPIEVPLRMAFPTLPEPITSYDLLTFPGDRFISLPSGADRSVVIEVDGSVATGILPTQPVIEVPAEVSRASALTISLVPASADDSLEGVLAFKCGTDRERSLPVNSDGSDKRMRFDGTALVIDLAAIVPSAVECDHELTLWFERYADSSSEVSLQLASAATTRFHSTP